MKKQLIKSYDKLDANSLEDFYMIVAQSIETSLIQSGAVPGNDYTLLDLYKLAQPFVLERFKTEKSLSYAVAW